MEKEYIKKPIPIKAVEIINMSTVCKITKTTPDWLTSLIKDGCFSETPDGSNVFMCDNNISKFEFGDYIIHGVMNDNYICKRDIFKSTYEEYNG